MKHLFQRFHEHSESKCLSILLKLYTDNTIVQIKDIYFLIGILVFSDVIVFIHVTLLILTI